MTKNPGMLLLAAALLAAPAGSEESRPADFADVFGERMVLQRDAPVRLWGNGTPGEPLIVELAGRRQTVSAGAGGRWQVEFPPLPAGGPYALRLEAGGEVLRHLDDVVIGDVWLCSGQSNMEYPVARASGGPHGPDRPERMIRLATVGHDSAVTPQAGFAEALRWHVADTATVADFSAVCWFFAEAVRANIDVPVGLIHASWGGSRIEAWLGAQALRDVGGFDAGLELLEAYAADPAAASRRFAASWEGWWRGSTSGEPGPWLAPGGKSDWKNVPGELRDWKAWGEAGLAAHNGMVWFRNSFELNAAQADAEAVLALGGVDEVDLTWVNGEFVGTGFGWGTERRYRVPAGLLRPGNNSVTVNVLSSWGSGGLLGPPAHVALELGDARVPLGSGWRYRRVPPKNGWPPRAPWESISGLTGLSNAMIAPLGEMPLTGAVWYQGESNAADAGTYERLLEALTADWRARFGESLAFVVVQLPNFGTPPIGPADSGWARIRDAQRRVAESDPRTGLVVTIDAGDDRDLHPPNKTIVGRRAAEVAGALVFENGAVVDGIAPIRASWQDGRVVIAFSPQDETLVVAGDRKPIAFELCGEGSGCVYADAVLDGNRILLTAPGMSDATRVRHCWADAPVCNLYGSSGLPVSSFEIAIR